jgi:hydrogenase-4 component B
LALPATGGLPTLALAVALALVTVALWRLSAGRCALPAPVWTSGQRVEPALIWTSSGFTKPLRLVLESVLRPERELAVHAEGGVVQEVVYEARVPHLFDTLVYEPASAAALRGAAVVRRLQSGSLRVYIVYLLGLVAVLVALVRLGILA